jgi:phage protein D
MAQVPTPAFTVKYNGTNITAYVTRLSYNDKQHGESDELTLTVEDSDGRWHNSWYPTKGDKLEATIRSMPCGTFEIDEVTLSGPGDSMTIKAISAGIKKDMRTRRTVAHEKKTLKEIATSVVSRHSMVLEGDFIDNPLIERVTQYQRDDLSFVTELADKYGYVVNVRDNKMIFTNRQKLETGNTVFKLDKSSLSTYSFTDKSQDTYQSANVSYENADAKELIQASVGSNTINDAAMDKLNTFLKAENKQQADIEARARLYKANSNNKTGRISLDGNERIVAGVNFELPGFGKFGSKWHVVSSTHDCDKSGGYSTSAEIKAVS